MEKAAGCTKVGNSVRFALVANSFAEEGRIREVDDCCLRGPSDEPLAAGAARGRGYPVYVTVELAVISLSRASLSHRQFRSFFIFASRCEPGERFAYVCTACGLLSGVPHYAKALAARHLNLGCVCIPRNLGVWWPGEERSRSLMKGGKRRPSAESCLLNGVPGWPLPLLDFYCSRSSRK